MAETVTPGEAFARALGAKDFKRVQGLLDPDISFRGLTPSRTWEGETAERVVDGILQTWFEEGDRIDGIDSIETDMVADRERVGYRFRVSNPDGHFVVEQQAYLSSKDGRIDWMRLVCSGWRPAE
jgi:hypothetical protein